MDKRTGLLRLLYLLLLLGAPAAALDCGQLHKGFCQGEPSQFGAGFASPAGHGGFGGDPACSVSRTPVVFVRGNGDSALGWDAPPVAVPGFPPPPNSLYDELRARGYQPCELFGVTFLSEDQQDTPERNYHRIEHYDVVADFIEAVLAHTGAAQVDIVSHSLGVTTALAALDYRGLWGHVRRFVNIAGGIRGLDACRATGHFNPWFSTCYDQTSAWEFGFAPDDYTFWWFFQSDNDWTGDGPASLRRAPQRQPQVRFYTLHAGDNDEVHCNSVSLGSCARGALFEPAANVQAQLDVGAGSTAADRDWDWSDGFSTNLAGGDRDGVGHFRARSNTGSIVFRMLSSDCRGAECAGDYGYGPVRVEGE